MQDSFTIFSRITASMEMLLLKVAWLRKYFFKNSTFRNVYIWQYFMRRNRELSRNQSSDRQYMSPGYT